MKMLILNQKKTKNKITWKKVHKNMNITSNQLIKTIITNHKANFLNKRIFNLF